MRHACYLQLGFAATTTRNNICVIFLDNIFYVVEYRDIFLTLLRKFDERKQTRTFLKDLIRCTHLFLKMFENYCK